ncbi:MAG: acyltransferase family protein [Armatimonadota bacterium]
MEKSEFKLPGASINCAKGFAMLFVVMQHVGNRADFPAYYEAFIKFTDFFNMPAFAFISGYLAYYSYQKHAVSGGWDGVWHQIGRRVKQLLVPYICAEGIYMVIQAVRNAITHQPLMHPETLTNLLLYPIQTPNPPLWYLYVLFLVSAIFLIMRKLLGEGGLLLALCLAAFFLPGDNLLYTRKIVFLLPFVALGWYTWKWKRDMPFDKRLAWLWIPAILLTITLLHYPVVQESELWLRPLRYVIAILGVLAMCGTGQAIQESSRLRKTVIWMGEVSLPVYLLHDEFANLLGQFAQRHLHGLLFLPAALVICALAIGLIGAVHVWLQPRSGLYRSLLLGSR